MFDKVFISYASEDFIFAEQLHNYLSNHNFTPWLDKKNLLPGQNWDLEIKKALREANYIVILLSNISVQKRGYVQREFKTVINYCEEKLDDDIYLIPVKISECQVPISLQKYQWVNFDDENALYAVVSSLELQRRKLESEEKRKTAAGGIYPYTLQEIRKQYGSFYTAEIVIKFFYFNPSKSESINEFNAIVKGDAVKSLSKLRQHFLAEFGTETGDADMPLYARQWSFVKEIKPELITSKLVSFTSFSYEYTGGAHGNYGSSGTTYLLDPLREVTLYDTVKHFDHDKVLNYLSNFCYDKLHALAHEFFQPEDDEEVSGILLHDGSLDLKWELFEFHYFSKLGVEIIFNPYTVSGYAFGQHTITVPYDLLKTVITDTSAINIIQEAANA